MTRYSLLVLFGICNAVVFGQALSGNWYGTLDVMGQKLPLVLHLSDSAGIWKGTLDSPKQQANGIPMSSVSVNGKHLRFTIDKLQASYEGELNDSMVIRGKFKQGAFTAELSFNQQETPQLETKKLQDPKEPVPYLQEEVSIQNPVGNFVLSGTLTHPVHTYVPDKIPCVILITGSGPQDRNEEILGHRPFLVLADWLTLSGYGVLRMDDRGTGKSEGVFNGATSADFATDIEAAIAFVKTLPYIDTQKIILMGHSEGGIIANMVAAKHPEVFGVISLAGPGVLGSTLLIEQQVLISKAVGASKKELKQIRAFSESFYPLLTLDSIHVVERKAEVFLTKYAKSIQKKELRENGITDRTAWVQMNLDAYVNPWMLYFLNYNPMVDLKNINCHYLALNGTTDLQVPAPMNLDAIASYCNPGPGKIKEIKALDGLNHMFQPSATGSPNEYGSNEITFDNTAIQEILIFLERITQ
ncbi:MAG: alpha/beta fold hydrolase [Crocinitomicaceae bacterium]|nr:alpha/beta fold hydrolase [Crocinitomicaceae bacterium]